jgi:DNA modification methylase
MTAAPGTLIEVWPIARLVDYARNPRRNDQAVDRMCASIREFGFKIPVLARSSGEVVDGHLRLKAARKLGIAEVPVILCDEWTDAQVKAFRLLVNRSVAWASWDDELLAVELQDIRAMGFDLSLTGFDVSEIDDLLAPAPADEPAPPPPVTPVTRAGDLWLLGPHRVICGDCCDAEVVARLLEDRKPILMVTDPPYGVELDSEWRDRAGLNSAPGVPRTSASRARAAADPKHPAERSYMRHPGEYRAALNTAKSRALHAKVGTAEPSYLRHRTEGHTEVSISGDTRADWSEAFALAPSLQVAYVWHASTLTNEVITGLLRIGFEHRQMLIWLKPTFTITRTLYWFRHEACWFVRKSRAPWYGERGAANTTVWEATSPKQIMGSSDEDKYDHPTQKPLELMRRPIINHLRRGELVYEPFLGSGTTLAAAEAVERVCYGIEIDPKYVDVVILRWQKMTGKAATLAGDGRTFDQLRGERLGQ